MLKKWPSVFQKNVGDFCDFCWIFVIVDNMKEKFETAFFVFNALIHDEGFTRTHTQVNNDKISKPLMVALKPAFRPVEDSSHL